MKKVLACMLLFLHISSELDAQSRASFYRRITPVLDSIALQDVPAGAPGIAAAVIVAGRIRYTRYGGFADLDDSTIIDGSSRFNIASNGKQFTALAVLSLQAENKLSLEDDIRLYFPSLFTRIADKITISHLLTHTSGIRDCYDLWSLQGITWWKQRYSNKDVVRLLEAQTELNFPPGKQYLYSNSNYILLAEIVEKASGRSFIDYTNTLFARLGMTHTSFEGSGALIKGPVARAYFNFGKWTTYEWKWRVYGDGNLFSSLPDLIQWELLLQGKGKTTINRKIIARSQQLVDSGLNRNYGFGLEFGEYKNIPYLFHEGATGAWKATVIRFPQKKLALITLTNTGKSIPAMQTRQMADVIYGLPSYQQYLLTKPSGIGPFISEEEVAGTYLTDNNFYFVFERVNNELKLKRAGRNDIVLERESANVFRQKNDTLFRLAFTRNAGNHWQVTAYYIDHSPYTLTKASADFSGFDFSNIGGYFVNNETGTRLLIQYLTRQDYEITFPGEEKSRAMIVSPTLMLVDGYSIQIADARAILLNGSRIRQVRFEKEKE